MENRDTTEILIASFSGNSDLWKLFDFFFKKYWPECPYTISLGANGEEKRTLVPDGWKYLHFGPDKSFAESLTQYLKAMKTNKVLLMLDDFLLTGVPDVRAIAKAEEHVDAGAKYVRLVPEPAPVERERVDAWYGKLRWYDRYRASLKAALWNRDFLLECLKADYDPWNFELEIGAHKPFRRLLFLGPYEPLLPNNHCVEAGSYTYWLPSFLSQEGYPDTLSSDRKVLTKEEYRNLFSSGVRYKQWIAEHTPAIFYFAARSVVKRFKEYKKRKRHEKE